MKNGTKEVDKWIVRINAAGPPSNLSAQVNYEKIDNGTGTADDAEFEKLPKIGHKARDAEAIETKWQRVWEEQNLYKTEE